MGNGVSINVQTGEVTETTVEPSVTPIASLQQEARGKRDAEFNQLIHRIDRNRREVEMGLTPTDDKAALNNYGSALADMTSDVGWGAAPIDVVDAIIITRP